MIYVGKFNLQDLNNGVDKKEVEQAKAKTGLKYTNTKIIKENGITYLKIWLCNYNEFNI